MLPYRGGVRVVLLSPFQATLYRQISDDYRPLDELINDLLEAYRDHPTIWSDLLYLIGNISVTNKEAQEYFGRLEDHRQEIEAALGYPVDLRVALMNYFTRVQRRYESPKIVEFREYQESLALALSDGLTGLLNRRSMEELLRNELARASRYKTCFSLVFVDVDNFKLINDSYGHHVGDETLQCFGQFLRAQIRGEDVAARWGGEEFVMLLPQTGTEGVQRFARRLLSAVHRHDFPDNISLTFSAGVAEYPRDGTAIETLVKTADERMYYAKHHGKDQVCLGAAITIGPHTGELPDGRHPQTN